MASSLTAEQPQRLEQMLEPVVVDRQHQRLQAAPSDEELEALRVHCQQA